MTDPLSQIPKGWLWSGLPDLEAEGTYDFLPADRQPKIERDLSGMWDWVPELDAPLDWAIADQDDPDAFLRDAEAAGVAVPESFRDFIRRPELRRAIRSGTGCWWSLGAAAPIAFVPALGHHVARFLTDQQDCVFWFVVLGEPDGPVVASFEDLTDEEPAEAEIWLVSSSFEEFMYRFWIENEIFFRDTAKQPLTPEQKTYLQEALLLARAEA